MVVRFYLHDLNISGIVDKHKILHYKVFCTMLIVLSVGRAAHEYLSNCVSMSITCFCIHTSSITQGLVGYEIVVVQIHNVRKLFKS